MTDSLAELVKLLPPPNAPEETGGDWQRVEADLGTALPDDYKEFISIYGTGAISCELWILNPFAGCADFNLFRKLEWLRQNYSAEYPRGGKHPFPPEGGLIPCGWSNANDFILWSTGGPPNDWGTVIDKRQALAFYEFPGVNFTDLLLRLVQRKIREYRILLINPPYKKKSVPYEYCTFQEVVAKKTGG